MLATWFDTIYDTDVSSAIVSTRAVLNMKPDVCIAWNRFTNNVDMTFFCVPEKRMRSIRRSDLDSDEELCLSSVMRDAHGIFSKIDRVRTTGMVTMRGFAYNDAVTPSAEVRHRVIRQLVHESLSDSVALNLRGLTVQAVVDRWRIVAQHSYVPEAPQVVEHGIRDALGHVHGACFRRVPLISL